nr:MAG TPA: hypothetical protein [Caudoviricetes sp.]
MSHQNQLHLPINTTSLSHDKVVKFNKKFTQAGLSPDP